jgi:hypothetical protein
MPIYGVVRILSITI